MNKTRKKDLQQMKVFYWQYNSFFIALKIQCGQCSVEDHFNNSIKDQ